MITYKFKLYRNEKNRLLTAKIDIAGIVYNRCIALHRRYYRLTGKLLNANRLKTHLAKLKKLPKYAFWKMLDAQAVQDVAERIDKAYQLFFGNLKRKVKTAPPGFKKVKKYSSFTLKQTGWKLIGSNQLVIMKETYRFHKSREILGNIKTVTMKRSKAGELYVYFVTDWDDDQRQPTTGNNAGFDFGLQTFLTCSDGTAIQSPLFLKRALSDKAKLQRRFSRCQQGSSTWHSLKYSLAKLDEHIANQRKDWFCKLAHTLTDKFDNLFFESLNLRGMVKLWGRKVSDLSFASFLDILKYVAGKKGKVVKCIDRFYPSSKTCNGCGHINHNLTLNDRRWRCPSCNTVVDRDANAALNILCEGTSSLAVGTVRPALQASAV